MKTLSKKVSFVRMGIVFGSMLFSHASMASAIVNGDFEAGNIDFSSDYIFSPGNLWPESSYDVLADPWTAHGNATSFGDHTTGTGLMLAVNGATTPGLAVWSQTVTVTPGTDYVFSAWLASWVPSSPAELQLLVNDIPVGAPFTAPLTAGLWEQVSIPWHSGADISATLKIVNLNTAGGGNDFALDDISFESLTPPPPTCDGEPADVTGIILTRAGALNDQAQFKLKHVAGIKNAATEAVNQGLPLHFEIGACGSPLHTISFQGPELNVSYLNLRVTQGNVDVVRCVFNTEECVINLKVLDFDPGILPGLLDPDVLVTLKVGNTVYIDDSPGGWTQADSGAIGSWTKYIKD
jgi:hypothetical protein